MQFEIYKNVHDFHRKTFDMLMHHESQNLVPLGNIIIGIESKDKTEWRDPANWFMATISTAAHIHLVAIMTPPMSLTIYIEDNKIDPTVIKCLIDGLVTNSIHLPGVMAEKQLALHFAKEYCAAKGITYTTSMSQRIYELTKVNPVEQVGQLRLADERDMHYFPYWLESFRSNREYGATTMNTPKNGDFYRHRLSLKNIYILEDGGQPVSTASIHREMCNAAGIGAVYTPAWFRGKGYATSCVAQVSQIALDKGFAKCVLYTDLANPTSNSIYQKIGYNPIADSLMLTFK